jgi:hypothetical protein
VRAVDSRTGRNNNNNDYEQQQPYLGSINEAPREQLQGSQEDPTIVSERRNKPETQNLLQVRQSTQGRHKTNETCAISIPQRGTVENLVRYEAWQQTSNQPSVDNQAEQSNCPQSYYAWNNRTNEEGYNDQIIRVSACKRRQKSPLYKVHFKNNSKSAWVTIDKIPPRVLSVFHVKSFIRKRNRRT